MGVKYTRKGLGGVADEEVAAFIDVCIGGLLNCLLVDFMQELPQGRSFSAQEATEGVNRGFEGLVKEYMAKWLEAVAPLNVDNGLSATRFANHVANIKDLLSNYIGRNNDGHFKAF